MKHDKKNKALKYIFCIFKFVISISCYLFLQYTNQFKLGKIAFAVHNAKSSKILFIILAVNWALFMSNAGSSYL